MKILFLVAFVFVSLSCKSTLKQQASSEIKDTTIQVKDIDSKENKLGDFIVSSDYRTGQFVNKLRGEIKTTLNPKTQEVLSNPEETQIESFYATRRSFNDNVLVYLISFLDSKRQQVHSKSCLLYTSDAADE